MMTRNGYMIILEMLAVLFLAAILEMTEIEVAKIPSFLKCVM